MTIFWNIGSFHVPNFSWNFNLGANLRADNCRGVIGVRLNKNQLLFKRLWSKLAWMCLIKYTAYMTIFWNIGSFHVPNFSWSFNLGANLRDDYCRGVIGVRLNKNQLLFKGIDIQKGSFFIWTRLLWLFNKFC